MFSRIDFSYKELLKITKEQKVWNGITEKVIDTIIITMDEPDIYLHPEWQRLLLSQILKYLEVVFKWGKYSINSYN